MIYPTFPKSGDRIGICAPSAGVGHKLDSFDQSLEVLQEQGLQIHETANVRTNNIRSAEAQIRGTEFNQLVLDSSISAIIAASGGEYALEMLPYIDWEQLRIHPKWFCGASDPTNILYPMTTKYDIATLYGFNAGTFDWRPLHTFQKNALALFNGSLIEQQSFDFYDGSHSYSEDGPHLDTPVRWELIATEASLAVEGRLLGGCLDCIAKLIGTPYDGTNSFLDRYDDIIWFFDPFQMNADAMYMTLLQMKHCGYFRNTKAILLGRVMFTEGSEDADYIERLSRLFDVPILWNCDIGHVKPCMTLINGSVATIQYNNGKGSITMRLE